MSEAQDITKQSKSNLAFALTSLPKQSRDDMVCFYAFCRIVDDIADDPGLPVPEKQALLDEWSEAAKEGFRNEDAPPLHQELAALTARYAVPHHLFLEIIEGVSQDITPRPFSNYDQLLSYCYKVACAVGLISIRIFGCTSPQSEKYAINLGYALQLTNILRDVGEDLENEGRIYLPLDHLQAFGLDHEALKEQPDSPQFKAMMEGMAQNAIEFFEKAERLAPQEDRKCLVASQAMSKIYRRLLEEIRSDGYRVFTRRYSLSKLRKVGLLASAWIQSRFS